LAFFSLFSYTRTILGYLILGDIPRKTRFPPHTPVHLLSARNCVEGKEKRTTGAAADEKELASQFLIC
jgi:hypothetical protein